MNAARSQSGQTEDRTPALTDARMEEMMGRLLQTGVLAAAAIVILGGALYVAHHGGEQVDYRTFRPKPLNLRKPADLLLVLRSSGSRGMLEAGILVLLATPICRVVFALVSFLMERDRLYVVVSAIVLAALLFGVFHGA